MNTCHAIDDVLAAIYAVINNSLPGRTVLWSAIKGVAAGDERRGAQGMLRLCWRVGT